MYSEFYSNGNIPLCRETLECYDLTYSDNMRRAEGLQKRATAISNYDTKHVQSLFSDQESAILFNKIIGKYKKADLDFSDIQCMDAQYFNTLFANDMRHDEVYVDAGVFDGRTIIDFIMFTKGTYKNIYAIEGDIVSHLKYSRRFMDFPNLIWTQCALSNSNGEADFVISSHGLASGLMARGRALSSTAYNSKFQTTKVQTIKLDTYLQEPPTFIKMDIEGAEQAAIAGAERTIKKYKPKLAISVYHEPDDLVKIPLMLNEMVPEYNLYLRHHSSTHYETVLYAKASR